jgi:hypothetical protein
MRVRINFIGPNAMTLRSLGSYNTDHRSPLEQSWGGWYVTGNSGSIRHRHYSALCLYSTRRRPAFAHSSATVAAMC